MAKDYPILPIANDDLPAVLALNNLLAADLSWLEGEDLARLVSRAYAANRIGAVEAMLIAFDQDADYDSPNFQWFRRRHERFVYVDRIAVAAAARGRGHARRLYEDLFLRATAAGHTLVTCEVNRQPPNPMSDAFHAALGFSVAGEAELGNGKSVRYFVRPLDAPQNRPVNE